MSFLRLLVAVAVLWSAGTASAQFVAEQVTAGNAATHLFGGSDAAGGIGDWRLSNAVVEAIIDQTGPQPDLVPLVGPLAPPKQNIGGFGGGTLVDLGLVGANNDQLGQIFTVGGISTSNFIVYNSVSGATTVSSATITANGELRGFDTGATPVPPANLPVVTDYTASGTDPFVTVTTTVTNTHATNKAAGLGGFLDVFIWIGKGPLPFTPLPNRGFDHVILDPNNIFAALELPALMAAPANLTPADGVLDPTSGLGTGEVAYGLLGVQVSLDQDGVGGNPAVVTTVNTLFGINNETLSAMGNILVTDPLSGGLEPSGILSYTRRLYAGNRNDVASVANPMITELATRQSFSTGTISGDVDGSDTPNVAASVVVKRNAGPLIPGFGNNAPATHFRTSSSGAFSGIVLPVGTYTLEFTSPERGQVFASLVTVSAATDTVVPVPPMNALGTVQVSVFERASLFAPDVNIPARITFKGIGGGSDPVFKKDMIALAIPAGPGSPSDIGNETFAGGPAIRNHLLLASGTGSIQVRPGRYEITASRGPEYTVVRRRIRVRAGKTTSRKFRLKRVVDSSGYISGDFHIHSARSSDSSAPLRDRVSSFAAEQLEVMVSTDHDQLTDYTSVIAGLSLSNLITSIPGCEISGNLPNPPAFPDSMGHINAWPLPVQPLQQRDGAFDDEFVAPNWIYSRARNAGATVVQYNHLRGGFTGLAIGGWFNAFNYDPDLPLTTPPNDVLLDQDVLGPGISGVMNPDGFRNLDFDVMELFNGTDVSSYLALRRDWFSLLSQTDFATVPFIPGTGVSDSHKLIQSDAGYPRSYVAGQDDPATLNVTAFNNTIKSGNMMVTTAPFISFTVTDSAGMSTAQMGQTLVPPTGNVLLNIRVQATNWIPVEEVRIYANGFLLQSFDATTTPAVTAGPSNPYSQMQSRVTRFQASVPRTVAIDTYFVVEAGAKLSPPPSSPTFVNKIVPGMVPLGFTNPIFVDLGGDGFDPPGLPVMASLSQPQPSTALAAEGTRRPLVARARSLWRALAKSVNLWGTAVATDEVEPLTGKELRAEVLKGRDTPTEHYFPLHRFKIPPQAASDAIEQLPEPDRSRVKEQWDPQSSPTQ